MLICKTKIMQGFENVRNWTFRVRIFTWNSDFQNNQNQNQPSTNIHFLSPSRSRYTTTQLSDSQRTNPFTIIFFTSFYTIFYDLPKKSNPIFCCFNLSLIDRRHLWSNKRCSIILAIFRRVEYYRIYFKLKFA